MNVYSQSIIVRYERALKNTTARMMVAVCTCHVTFMLLWMEQEVTVGYNRFAFGNIRVVNNRKAEKVVINQPRIYEHTSG